MGQRVSDLKKGLSPSSSNRSKSCDSQTACNIVSNMSCKKDTVDSSCEETLDLQETSSVANGDICASTSCTETLNESVKQEVNVVDNTKYESVMPKKVNCSADKPCQEEPPSVNKTFHRKTGWQRKFNCRIKCLQDTNDEVPQSDVCEECVCTGYRKVADEDGDEVTTESEESSLDLENSALPIPTHPVIDLTKFHPEDYPTEDCDERARLERAREMEQGIEPPPDFEPELPTTPYQAGNQRRISIEDLSAILSANIGLNPLCSILAHLDIEGLTASDFAHIDLLGLSLPLHCHSTENCATSTTHNPIHTQIDYIHCLVPDLLQINNCSFYWGKMDRYEAEKLLENKPEGTFLLRDSAQEEYLFSVSFRRYGRSLHARIEQWDHKFSFDSHDPGVFSSTTVCGLIEHYKDPTSCMFFEPMLTIPLHRNFVFNMQHLCRSVICSNITYNNINSLQLPKPLKNYLKEYHYKQRVRVRRLDSET